jgi:hypothetical protein
VIKGVLLGNTEMQKVQSMCKDDAGDKGTRRSHSLPNGQGGAGGAAELDMYPTAAWHRHSRYS